MDKTSIFSQQAQIIHGTKYDYSEAKYKNVHTKVTIICPKHGKFQQTPNNHLRGNNNRGQGCPTCAGVTQKNTPQFVAEARYRFGNLYDYSLVKYRNAQSRITIICPKHGQVKQSPTSHLNSITGCPKCGNEKRLGRYNKKSFEKFEQLDETPAHLYAVKMFNNVNTIESFIKIGICTTSVTKRLHGNTKEYLWDIMHDTILPLKIAYELEQTLLDTLEKEQYIPTHKFAGHTECLVHTSTVLNTLNEHLETKHDIFR